MLNRTITESILALFAGRERASAIYGDLVEVAGTRGIGWFWSAYLRTLFSLTWKLVLALFVGVVLRETAFDLFHVYMAHTPAQWRAAPGPYLYYLNSSGPLLACIMSTLWFVLPYAVVLYGWRDRFVRLTLAVALGTTVAFLFVPVASFCFAVTTLALGVAALLSQGWRRQGVVLAGTVLFGIASVAMAATASRSLQEHMEFGVHPVLKAVLNVGASLAFSGGLLLLAIVCSQLHRRMIQVVR